MTQQYSLKNHQFRVLISEHAKTYAHDKKDRLNKIILWIDELKFETLDLILRESLLKKSQGLENHRLDHEEFLARRNAYNKKLQGGSIGKLSEGDLVQEESFLDEAEIKQLPPAPEASNG
ncbi:MAG: hypothetical protein IPG22_20000 [Acidobacteria bacterium]|nr:hypothetical protein [Acidobacteriota bacterium]